MGQQAYPQGNLYTGYPPAYIVKVAPLQAVGNPNHLRLLLLLRRQGPLRFQAIQDALNLNPAQVDRSLKFLSDGFWVLPRTIPTHGKRIYVEYRLSKKGGALLEAWDAFASKLKQKKRLVGSADLEAVENLQSSIH